MDFEELKSLSNVNVLLRGKSGRGKTHTSSEVALGVADAGGKVLYMDTEAEGATTLVTFVENGVYEEDAVENVTYEQVEEYEEVMEMLEEANGYDLLIFDTLDSKHTMALKEVTDATLKADADWNQYPFIYSAEKEMMKQIRSADCNVICCLDPDSGSMDKPKLCQTNVHGAFSVVIDMSRSSQEWNNTVRNWVGNGDIIGKSVGNLEEALINEVKERSGL